MLLELLANSIIILKKFIGKQGLFDEAVGFFIKCFFASFSAKVVGFALKFACPLRSLLVHFHTTDRVLHRVLPLF